uniref:Guanosine-3',5'-bis(diphosphate) 3'-pyrophosphohydrolase MESH1 n=1 Tax=Seriola lalandi dorsalis TaxID=1841481 RepID=A0A3B4WDF4_SERLL
MFVISASLSSHTVEFSISCITEPRPRRLCVCCSSLQAALLHDTVEDTDTTPAELEAKFGPTVARIVEEVTDEKSLPKQERKRLQVEHAPHCSRQAKLVKLADKLYNLRDLNRCTPVGWTAQ